MVTNVKLATRECFRDLCRRLGARDNPITERTIDGTYNELFSAYTGPDRHYHDLKHIDEGLELIDRDDVRLLAENPDVLEMAWWWHDETYETNDEAKFNESTSAVNAFRSLRDLGVFDKICAEVLVGIMPTMHSYIPTQPNHMLIVDIDLVRLADPWETFCINTENIRKEYGTTPEEFKVGQAQFLRNFTKNRPSVFLTDYFRERYETQAQENIRRVLAQTNI